MIVRHRETATVNVRVRGVWVEEVVDIGRSKTICSRLYALLYSLKSLLVNLVHERS